MKQPKFAVGQRVRLMSAPAWSGGQLLVGSVQTIQDVEYFNTSNSYFYRFEIRGDTGVWAEFRLEAMEQLEPMPGPKGVLP